LKGCDLQKNAICTHAEEENSREVENTWGSVKLKKKHPRKRKRQSGQQLANNNESKKMTEIKGKRNTKKQHTWPKIGTRKGATGQKKTQGGGVFL